MAKAPTKDDLTTTRYGVRFLELANDSQPRPGVKVRDDALRKYRVGPGQLSIPVSHRAHWLDDETRRRIGPLIDALEIFDKRRDKGPLVALLQL